MSLATDLRALGPRSKNDITRVLGASNLSTGTVAAARKEAEARAEHIKMLMWMIPSLGIPIIILIIIVVAIIKS